METKTPMDRNVKQECENQEEIRSWEEWSLVFFSSGMLIVITAVLRWSFFDFHKRLVTMDWRAYHNSVLGFRFFFLFFFPFADSSFFASSSSVLAGCLLGFHSGNSSRQLLSASSENEGNRYEKIRKGCTRICRLFHAENGSQRKRHPLHTLQILPFTSSLNIQRAYLLAIDLDRGNRVYSPFRHRSYTTLRCFLRHPPATAKNFMKD